VGRVLARVLPLALGAAVNTRVLATEAALLAGSAPSLRVAALFGAGATAPLLLVGVIDVISVHVTVSTISEERALYASSVADVVVGGLLLLAAAWVARSGGRRGVGAAGPSASRTERQRVLIRGAAVMATDLSTMAMFVTASKDIAVSNLGVATESLLFLLALVITAVTAWLPLLLYVRDPVRAGRLLGPIGQQVQRHGRVIAVVLLVAFGAYLVGRGVVGVV
jgi:hypothetical protein